jgi:hypothetical protein
MANTNQNFSIYVGDDLDVDYDIGPDTTGLNLDNAQQLTWKAYAQALGVPDKTTTLISKTKAAGIIITDPTALTFTVHLAPIDSIGQNGNLYYEIKIVDIGGKVSTPTIGLMTVIDPAVTPNVAAFKTMFPEFADIDDTIVQIAIDQAGQFVDDTWGTSEDDAIMYLAAHFIATAQMTSESGGRLVTAERIGQISVNYASAMAVEGKTGGVDPLSTTSYGLIFGNMLAGQGFGILIV